MIVRKAKDQIEPYLRDASNFKGRAEEVYVPETIEELKQAVSDCHSKKQLMTLSGAGTGLSGARAPMGGAVISTELLNRIISIDYENMSAKLEPGVTLAQLEAEIFPKGYFYPPNPTEKNGSLGGNVVTNASGARTFKYGATREFINSLDIILCDGRELKIKRGEVFAKGNRFNIALADGSVMRFGIPALNMPDVKQSAGYYLKPDMDAIDLFIGSEGTLGIIAGIEVRFIHAPEAVLGGIVFFQSDSYLFDFLDYARTSGNKNRNVPISEVEGIAPRLLEYFDNNSLRLLSEKYPQIPDVATGAIWFEQEYEKRDEDRILNEWNEAISRFSDLSDNTWIAMSASEHERLKEFRHSLPLAVADMISRNGQQKIGTDTAVPEEYFRDYYYFVKSRIEHYELNYVIFGHFGNCHIHANALPATAVELERGRLFFDDCIAEAIRLGGTVSGEHGIGKIKNKYLRQLYGDDIVEKMREIKFAFDPDYLLCRGNLF